MSSEENKCPEFIKNKIDLKALTIGNFNAIITSLANGNNNELKLHLDSKVILFTNFGMVEGEFISHQDDSNNPAQLLSEMIFNARNAALETLEKEIDNPIIVNNSSVICLLNATITPYANPNNKQALGILNLFSDQIVGFTFGDKES